MKTPVDGEFTTALGKLFQGLIILTVENVHFIYSFNFVDFSFWPLDLILPLSARLESPLASEIFFRYVLLEAMIKLPLNLLFDQLNISFV